MTANGVVRFINVLYRSYLRGTMGRRNYSVPLVIYSTGDMKYSQTINLAAGMVTPITTTLTTEPYSIMLIDSEGNMITNNVGEPKFELFGGVYVISIYSTEELNGVELRILY